MKMPEMGDFNTTSTITLLLNLVVVLVLGGNEVLLEKDDDYSADIDKLEEKLEEYEDKLHAMQLDSITKQHQVELLLLRIDQLTDSP